MLILKRPTFFSLMLFRLFLWIWEYHQLTNHAKYFFASSLFFIISSFSHLSISVEDSLIDECANFLGFGKGIDGLVDKSSSFLLIFTYFIFQFFKDFFNFTSLSFNSLTYFLRFKTLSFTFKIYALFKYFISTCSLLCVFLNISSFSTLLIVKKNC